MLTVLREPTYRRLFSAQIGALLGTGLLTVALGLLAFDLAGGQAGAVLGTALAIKMLAYVLVAPVMAALVERFAPKGVLICADLVRAGVALSLPFIDQTWQIYAAVFVLQSASATFTPAFQSLIPRVLTRERDYTSAISLSRLAYDLESLISPLLAAMLLTVMAYNNLFLGTVAGFVFSAILVAVTRLPGTSPGVSPGSLLHRTTLGTRIFLREPPLRALAALNLVVACATALVLVNTVVYARDIFALSNADVAIALACYGSGSMVVALSTPWVLERVKEKTVMLAGGLLLPPSLGAAALIVWAEQSWPLLLLTWVVLGMGTSMISTPSARLLRRHSNDVDRSFVYTAQFSLSHACFLISYPLAGWLGAAAGQPAAAGALGLVATLGTVAAIRLWKVRSTNDAVSPQGLKESVPSEQRRTGS